MRSKHWRLIWQCPPLATRLDAGAASLGKLEIRRRLAIVYQV